MCDHTVGCVQAGADAPKIPLRKAKQGQKAAEVVKTNLPDTGYSATTGLSKPMNVGGDVIPVGIINDEGKVFLINGGELIGCNESADLCTKPIKIETWGSGETIYQIPGGTYFIVYKTK